jgi:hypothetical protein
MKALKSEEFLIILNSLTAERVSPIFIDTEDEAWLVFLLQVQNYLGKKFCT